MTKLRDLGEQYNELATYTLTEAQGDPSFIHQYVVDAYGAQLANEESKNIAVAFALIGLYLAAEKNFTGREVQLAHIKLANGRKNWPKFVQDGRKHGMTIGDVLLTPPGKERNEMIFEWVKSAWHEWSELQQEIRDLAKEELGEDYLNKKFDR